MRSILFIKRNLYISLILSFLINSTLGAGLAKGLSEASEHSKLFPEIKGWRISGEMKVYTPETLIEYINCAAELYLSYDFQELQVAEYLNEKNASIIIAGIYSHKTPVYTFGVYSQKRPAMGDFLNIGAQAYIETVIIIMERFLFPVKGNIFGGSLILMKRICEQNIWLYDISADGGGFFY